MSGTYRTHDEINQMYKNLCDNHPEWASYEIAGQTLQGNDIWLFKVGNPEMNGVFIEGCLH